MKITYKEFRKKLFGTVLCNSINNLDLELYSGNEFDDEDNFKDFFQYYLINKFDANYISRFTDEVVYYNDLLDVYVWAIDFCGMSWDNVTLEIKEVV